MRTAGRPGCLEARKLPTSETWILKATGILTAKEAIDVMKKAGDVVYRPPSK